jgi:PAT family beta-lactamase induction signal transducer AmpG
MARNYHLLTFARVTFPVTPKAGPFGTSCSTARIVTSVQQAFPQSTALASSAASDSTPVAASKTPVEGGDASGTHKGNGLGSVPWVATTYYGEGLPYSIVHQVSAELFTAFGASLAAIGYTSLYGLAWNFKFLWSPAVDFFGQKRSWVAATQIALAIAIFAIAIPAQNGDLPTVAWGLIVVSILAATQDIAVDGFYLEALPDKRQAAFSGLRVGAFRVAMLVGKGGLVVLAGIAGGWKAAFFAAGAMMLLLGIGHALLLPRPAQIERTERRALKAFWRAFVSFLMQPKVGLVLAFVLTYRAGDALMFNMGTPFLKDLGLSLTQRGIVSGTWGTLASVGGSMVGGVIVSRWGLERTLRPIAIAQGFAILLYAWLAFARPALPSIIGIVLVEQLVAGIGTAGLMVFLMRRCHGAYKASHFAIASALMSVGTTVAGIVSGKLAARFGFPVFFLIAFAAAVPGMILSWFVPTNRADEVA